MKRGFSLIEIIVALALASLLTIALYTSFNQTRKIAKKIEGIIDKSTPLMLLYSQLERNFTAITIPSSVLIDQNITSTGQNQLQNLPPERKKEKELTPEMIKSIFNVEIKGQEKEISFVTTSPLLAYQEIKPHLVRVIYRLLPMPEREGDFMITRQEFQEVGKSDAALEKSVQEKGIPLVEGITKMEITYIVLGREKKEKRELTEWNSAENDEIQQVLPHYIIFKGILKSSPTQQPPPFTITVNIPAAVLSKKPAKKDKGASSSQLGSLSGPPSNNPTPSHGGGA